MTPPTEIRLSVTVATIQLQPAELTEADLKAPAAEFARMTHANERASLGKLFIHKAEFIEEKKGGDATMGLMQSGFFDTDKSNGRDELRDMMEEVKNCFLDRIYPPYEPGKLILS